MSSENTVTVVGNLARAPELRFTQSGQAVASFGLAVNRRWQNKQTQEWEEAVSFFDITCWGQLGENVAETADKGDRVIVVGRLEQQTWETQDGEKRSKVQITADEVGPSLRWASAEITRNERKEGAGSSRDNGGGRSASRSSGGRSSTRSSTRSSSRSGAPYDESEEPF